MFSWIFFSIYKMHWVQRITHVSLCCWCVHAEGSKWCTFVRQKASNWQSRCLFYRKKEVPSCSHIRTRTRTRTFHFWTLSFSIKHVTKEYGPIFIYTQLQSFGRNFSKKHTTNNCQNPLFISFECLLRCFLNPKRLRLHICNISKDVRIDYKKNSISHLVDLLKTVQSMRSDVSTEQSFGLWIKQSIVA